MNHLDSRFRRGSYPLIVRTTLELLTALRHFLMSCIAFRYFAKGFPLRGFGYLYSGF